MLSPKRRKLRQLSWPERWLLLEATFWLALARLSLLIIPFRKIAPYLGQTSQESPLAVTSARSQQADLIGWAVRAIARRTPWESACLAQAISAKAMLRRRRMTSTLYLGLAKDKTQKMQAHAWLRCGPQIITGGAGHERFSVISFFSEASPTPEKSDLQIETVELMQALLLDCLNVDLSQETAVQLKNLAVTEWEQLLDVAKQQHVLTLLWAQIQALGAETAVPPHLLEEMQQKFQQVTLHNLAIYRQLHLVHQQLAAAHIPMVVLKGTFLATAVYPHIGQRAMGDIDFLVPQDQLVEVVDNLHALGWQETRPIAMEANLKEQHHLPAFAKKGVNLLLEPHWNIVRPQKAYSISPEPLWQQVQSATLAGTEVLVFKPHVQLLHLALHAAYNHQFAFDLRSLCDIAHLIHVSQDTLEWNQVVSTARAWGWDRGVYLTLMLINDFWPGTAVPTEILVALKPSDMPDQLVEMAKQQLLNNRVNNKKVSINFAKLQANKSLASKAKWTLRFLFPTRNRLSWRYGVPKNSAKIWLYYLINFQDMIRRNAKRSWQLLTGTTEVVEAAERRNQLSIWLGTKYE